MDYYDTFTNAISQDLYDLIISKLGLTEYIIIKMIRRSKNYYNIINDRYHCVGILDGKNYNGNFYEALLLLELKCPELVRVLRCYSPGDKIEEIRFIAEFLRDHLIARQEKYGDIVSDRIPDILTLSDNILDTDVAMSNDPSDVVAGMAVKSLFNYRYPYILRKYKEFDLNLDIAVKMMLLYARLDDISITDSVTNYDKILKHYISYKGNGSPILSGYDFDFEDWIIYDETRGYRTLYKKYGFLKTSYDEDLDVYHRTMEDTILASISHNIVIDNGDIYLTLFMILEKDFRYDPISFEFVLATIKDVLIDNDSYTDIIKDKLLQRYPQYRNVL